MAAIIYTKVTQRGSLTSVSFLIEAEVEEMGKKQDL